ncbi:MAG TPA: PH domain-containing protein [Bryobacteraceae bacterium]|nr:PH domain-containing protein [Bryobacteraceae bacterium]
MSDLTIRPTAKFLKAGTILTAVVFLAIEIGYFAYWRGNQNLALLPLIAPLIFVWPAARWLRLRSTQAVVTGDRLRYQTGIGARTTRTIQLSKLQDVRVDQGLWQRILNIGDISLETSGEASRLTIGNIDRPQAVADELLNRSHLSTAGGASS